MRSKSKEIQTFAIAEVAQISGLSLAMLNYLCRSELVVPTGGYARTRGKARRYTFGDVVVLRALGKMLESGVSVSGLKAALKDLRKRHPELTVNNLPASHLVTDGKRVYLRQGSEVLEMLSTGQLTFAFIVELSSLRAEVVSLAANLENNNAVNGSGSDGGRLMA